MCVRARACVCAVCVCVCRVCVRVPCVGLVACHTPTHLPTHHPHPHTRPQANRKGKEVSNMPGAATASAEAKVAPLTPSIGPLNSGPMKTKPKRRGGKKHNKKRDFRHVTSATAPTAVAENLDPVHKTVDKDTSKSGPNESSPEAPAKTAGAPTSVNAGNTGNCPENAGVDAKSIGIWKALTTTLALMSAVATFTFGGLHVAGSSYQMLLEDSIRISSGDVYSFQHSGVNYENQGSLFDAATSCPAVEYQFMNNDFGMPMPDSSGSNTSLVTQTVAFHERGVVTFDFERETDCSDREPGSYAGSDTVVDDYLGSQLRPTNVQVHTHKVKQAYVY